MYLPCINNKDDDDDDDERGREGGEIPVLY